MVCWFSYVVFEVVLCMFFTCCWLFSGSLSSLRIASNIAPLKVPQNDLSRLLNYLGVYASPSVRPPFSPSRLLNSLRFLSPGVVEMRTDLSVFEVSLQATPFGGGAAAAAPATAEGVKATSESSPLWKADRSLPSAYFFGLVQKEYGLPHFTMPNGVEDTNNG